MTNQRHIGGSILPSTPHNLKPLECEYGTLIVSPIPKLDTHVLYLVAHDGETYLIAQHPNGYSCLCLAERLASGKMDRAKQQAEFIVACGGEADLSSFGN